MGVLRRQFSQAFLAEKTELEGSGFAIGTPESGTVMNGRHKDMPLWVKFIEGQQWRSLE